MWQGKITIAALIALIVIASISTVYLVSTNIKYAQELESLQGKISQLEDSIWRLKLILERTESIAIESQKELQILKEVKTARIEIPAVETGLGMPRRGVMIPMEISLAKGPKGIYIEISDVFTGVGTDKAAKRAVIIAREILNTTFDEYQVLFKFSEPKAEDLSYPIVVDGESGGAGFTVALVSTLSGYPINPNMTITGTMELFHEVGHVGGVYLKAIAAREAGYKKLLVPKTNRMTVPGIEIIPVSSIEEVLDIMLVGYSQPLIEELEKFVRWVAESKMEKHEAIAKISEAAKRFGVNPQPYIRLYRKLKVAES